MDKKTGRWIKTLVAKHDGKVINEVKCSNCGYKVTYHGNKMPKRCYVCESIMEEKND